MNQNILAFDYLLFAGGEQSVKMIDPQYVSIKQKDTYNPLFPQSPNLKFFNCDMNKIVNYPCKFLIIRNGPP